MIEIWIVVLLFVGASAIIIWDMWPIIEPREVWERRKMYDLLAHVQKESDGWLPGEVDEGYGHYTFPDLMTFEDELERRGWARWICGWENQYPDSKYANTSTRTMKITPEGRQALAEYENGGGDDKGADRSMG